MNIKNMHSIAGSALLLMAVAFGYSENARAGNVSNAQLSCYIDTNAYDTPTIGRCTAAWTPWSASNPSPAVFEVVGLIAGSYTFYWTDLSTGQVGVCATNSVSCVRSIFVNGIKSVRVTVVDNQTGASKTISATARFLDGYH